MSRNPGQLTLDVLHIRPSESASATDMDHRLAHADHTVESCDNVYAGLARLCRGDRPMPGMLIVCVDGLAAPEMEFFSLASQRRGAPDMYVYGAAHATPKLDEAVRLGAIGPVTDAVLATLDERLADDRDDSAQTLAFVGATVPEPTVTPIHPQHDDIEPTDPEPLPAPSAEVDSVDAAEEPAGPARVPWKQHNERPTRGRPQIKPPPALNDQPNSATEASDPHEPLLTAAELEALLGDDIAAIVPDRPRPAGPGAEMEPPQ